MTITLDRESAGAYYNRFGNILATVHYHLLAIDTFEKAITIDPQNPLYHLHLARSYTALGLTTLAAEARHRANSLK